MGESGDCTEPKCLAKVLAMFAACKSDLHATAIILYLCGKLVSDQTQDILLRTTNDWKTALELGHVVVTVMTDLSKSF